MKQIYPHPPSERFFELSTLYYQLHSTFSKGKVDMTSVHIPYDKHKCGTPACFAGWFRIGIQTFLNKKEPAFFSYSAYASRMAKFIFPEQNWNKHDLCNWANQNPEIWGNISGSFMFSVADAFNTTDEEINLEKIATHLKKVGQRLWEIERKEIETKGRNFIIQLEADLKYLKETDLITTDEVK